MIIDTSNTLAVFDPSLVDDGKIKPIPVIDSKYEVVVDALHVLPGNGDRRVVYFKLDPKFAALHRAYYDLTIQYLDDGFGEWFVEHISSQQAKSSALTWVRSPAITLNGSGHKLEVCLRIENAQFTGQANGADMRLVIVDNYAERFVLNSLRVAAGPEMTLDKRLSRFVYPDADRDIQFSHNSKPVASIVIPVFNNLDYTLDCLRAISEFTEPVYEVIVVNDASTDDTLEVLSTIANIVLVTCPSNIGFGRACNVGAEHARGEYLVFLNNDTIPQPGWLARLIECADRTEQLGALGSRLIFPQTHQIQALGVRFGSSPLPVDNFRNYPVDDPEVCGDIHVEALCGACLLLKRSVFEDVSGFDEGFLNGLEDIDLCLTLGARGLTNKVCAQSDVLHYTSASLGRFGLEKDRANTTLFHQKWNPLLADTISQSDDLKVGLTLLPKLLAADFNGFDSQTGTKLPGQIQCLRSKHPPGHCVHGPYLRTIGNFTAQAIFKLNISNIGDSPVDIVSLDVYDSTNDKVLSSRAIRFSDPHEGTLAPSLEFVAQQGQILEFRVYWHGTSDLIFLGLEITSPTSA